MSSAWTCTPTLRARVPGCSTTSPSPIGSIWSPAPSSATGSSGCTTAGTAKPAVDMHDEWQSGERHYLSEGPMAELKPTSDTGAIAADRQRRVAPGINLKAHHIAGHCRSHALGFEGGRGRGEAVSGVAFSGGSGAPVSAQIPQV